jgi:hypothetical protein
MFPLILMAKNIDQPNHTSIYTGRYANANILIIFPKIFTDNLKYKDISIVSLT